MLVAYLQTYTSSGADVVDKFQQNYAEIIDSDWMFKVTRLF